MPCLLIITSLYFEAVDVQGWNVYPVLHVAGHDRSWWQEAGVSPQAKKFLSCWQSDVHRNPQREPAGTCIQLAGQQSCTLHVALSAVSGAH